MLKVLGMKEVEVDYCTVDDFLDDALTDEVVIEILNELHEEIEVPGIGIMPAGEVIFKMTDGDKINYRPKWDVVCEDIFAMEREYLEEELVMHGETVYYGYHVSLTKEED